MHLQVMFTSSEKVLVGWAENFCGLWFVVYGLWFMVCGLWFEILWFEKRIPGGLRGDEMI